MTADHRSEPRTDGEGWAPSPPRIERRRFWGAEGIRRLPVEGRFESRDPDAFEAEVIRAQLGSLVLRRTTMTAHRAVLDDAEVPDVLRLLSVQRGSMLAAPPGGKPVRLGIGEALFTSRSHAYVLQVDEPIVVVASTLPLTSLPPALRALEGLPVGPLPHSPLVDAVVDLLAGLAHRLDEPWSFDADHAATGLIALETAILTELIGPQPQAPGPDRVLNAALDHIERHLGEPELRPPQIAAALGVSLRYLHRAFDTTDTTVSRHLRERRLEQVAQRLRADGRPPSLQRLADRYGFTSQDQLARAFRRRFGASMTEYRASTRT